MATKLFIGYMDEEVASLLRVVLLKNPATQVVLFERGFLQEPVAELLERPIAQFTDGADAGPRDVSVAYHDMKELFASKAGKIDYGEYLDRRRDQRIDLRQQRKALSSVVTEVRFGAAGAESFDDDAEPIYFIRAPEMGKQPGVVRLYLRMIIRYLKTTRSVGDVLLGSYGAGGGIVSGGRPGALHEIIASVFVGPDMSDGGELHPNVELIHIETENVEFVRVGLDGVAGHGPLTHQAEQLFYGDRMLPRIREAFRANPIMENSVSVTFPYFDSSEVKRAVDRSFNDLVVWRIQGQRFPLGDDSAPQDHVVEMLVPATAGEPPLREKRTGTDFVVNSNMEDYHLLRVAASMWSDQAEAKNYPSMKNMLILRVDSNVVASEGLEGTVKDYVSDKILDVSLSPEDFAAIVAWGKRGCPFTQDEIDGLPDVAKTWHTALDLDVGDALLEDLATFWFDDDGTPHLGVPESDDDRPVFCMEPLCVEIATDYRDDLPTAPTGLWYRGAGKWKGLSRAGFLSSGDTDAKAALAKPENLDRMLYKSSGAPVLQVKAYEAYDQFDAKLVVPS